MTDSGMALKTQRLRILPAAGRGCANRKSDGYQSLQTIRALTAAS